MLKKLLIHNKKTVRTGIITAKLADNQVRIDFGDGQKKIADLQVDNALVGMKVSAVRSGGATRVVSVGGLDSGEIKTVYIRA